MQTGGRLSEVAIDLTRLHRRTVTSFYSDLVTRPTGRAVRMGVEKQLEELAAGRRPCLSILDFSQVRVMDYSCADEIVAKLLLRYTASAGEQVYFLARGLQEHHLEAVEAVLERHGLLLAAEGGAVAPALLGPARPQERSCWEVLVGLRRAHPDEVVRWSGLGEEEVRATMHRFLSGRVAVAMADGVICPVPQLNCD